MEKLKETEKDLKSLMKQLREVDDLVINPFRLRKKNEKNILLRIPKFILLAKICSYLKFQQINSLASTCRSLRKTIYGPIGFKIILKFISPYPIKVISLQTQFAKKMKKISLQNYEDPHEDYEDEKFVEGERNKFKTILKDRYHVYKNAKQKYQALEEKVRSQKNHLFKLKETVKYFQNIKEKLEEDNNLHKDKLKSLSMGFLEKIKVIDENIDQQLKQTTKLQNQKQALAGKVREYQKEIQQIKIDCQNKKQILDKLNNYLLSKQL